MECCWCGFPPCTDGWFWLGGQVQCHPETSRLRWGVDGFWGVVGVQGIHPCAWQHLCYRLSYKDCPHHAGSRWCIPRSEQRPCVVVEDSSSWGCILHRALSTSRACCQHQSPPDCHQGRSPYSTGQELPIFCAANTWSAIFLRLTSLMATDFFWAVQCSLCLCRILWTVRHLTARLILAEIKQGCYFSQRRFRVALGDPQQPSFATFEHPRGCTSWVDGRESRDRSVIKTLLNTANSSFMYA